LNINQNILNIVLNTVTNVKTTEYVVETELGKGERVLAHITYLIGCIYPSNWTWTTYENEGKS